MVGKIKGRRSSSSVKERHTVGMLVHNRSSTIVSPGSDTDSLLALLKEEAHSGDHFLTPAQLSMVYRTNTHTGLSEAFALDLHVSNGPNTLKKFYPPDYIRMFCNNLFGWLQCALWGAAILSFCASVVEENIGFDVRGLSTAEECNFFGSVIVVVVLSTGLFNFYKEATNAMVLSGYKKMVPAHAFVMRDSQWKRIPTANVVVGDIVELTAGQVVPADIRILTCNNFTTEMSVLTGQSAPVQHVIQCTNVNPIESRNMCYFGCPVLEGSARGVVVATGENTQLGKIAGLATGLEKYQTPINKDINYFIKIICGVAFLLGFFMFIVFYASEVYFIVAYGYMLGIVFANVPAGLCITLTVLMTLASYRLKNKHCLAKTPHVVKTLGSTSVICVDKTGTLTGNQMAVSHLMTNYTIYDKNDHTGAFNKSYFKLTFVASLNLKAVFEDHNEVIDKRRVVGDASEAAILRYMETYRSATKTQQENKKVAEIPFKSENKYNVTIHELAETNSYMLIMKGAPEIILDYCTHIETDSPEVEDMTPKSNKKLKSIFEQFANMGERVIAYASSLLPMDIYPIGFAFNCTEPNFPINNLDFIGAISLMDRPRENIKKYIGICREAGIKVVMVTGDHPMTALAISRQCGTITFSTAYDYAIENHIDVIDAPQHTKKIFKAAVFTGEELRKMSPIELRAVLTYYEEVTFARTSPQQKLFIVETYQALGNIVAVTGDGVNDSPALKKADVGIAMGTGAEVCKQAADLILLDDNFGSIIYGIEEGRRIFDNLKKTIAYTLTSNTPEMMPFLMYAYFQIPLPMTLMMIIVINLGTDLLPAISLGYEKSEEDVMKLSPRHVNDRLVNKVLLFMAYFQIGLIEFCAGMFAYFVTFAQYGFFPNSLLRACPNWDDEQEVVNDIFDRPYTYNDRKKIERLAQTSYFVAVCWTQISTLIIYKSRKISILKKGMKNIVLNLSIAVSVFVVLIVTYIPACNDFFGTEAISVADLFLALPFMVFILFSDEMRRYIIRNNYSKWVETEMYF